MSLRVNNNIASVNGHRNMVKNDAMLSKSLERLSSGLRINRASDGAASLIISEQMRAQLSGLGAATQNAETASAMIQTAEGALDEINTLLNKARALAVHAGNEGANDQAQLVADQAELDNIVDSVTRIAENTQFGNKKLLDGSGSVVKSASDAVASASFGGQYLEAVKDGTISKGFHTLVVTQAATRATSTLTISGTDIITGNDLTLMSGNEQFQKAFTVSIMGSSITVASGTTKSQFLQQLNSIGKSAGFSASLTGTTGTGAVTLTATKFGREQFFNLQFIAGSSGAQTIAGTHTSGVDSLATIYFNTGADGAVASTGTSNLLNLTGKGFDLFSTQTTGAGFTLQLSPGAGTGTYAGALDGTGGGATFQIGANVGQTATVSLSSSRAADIGRGASGAYKSMAEVKGGALIAGNSDEVLKVIDKAIDDVTTVRGGLGAFQANTLETTLNSLRVSTENLTAAESIIRDVDFAAESANFTKNNILLQASTAMMAQANQLPQNVLQLLG